MRTPNSRSARPTCVRRSWSTPLPPWSSARNDGPDRYTKRKTRPGIRPLLSAPSVPEPSLPLPPIAEAILGRFSNAAAVNVTRSTNGLVGSANEVLGESSANLKLRKSESRLSDTWRLSPSLDHAWIGSVEYAAHRAYLLCRQAT